MVLRGKNVLTVKVCGHKYLYILIKQARNKKNIKEKKAFVRHAIYT